jgi:hypothetical protein
MFIVQFGTTSSSQGGWAGTVTPRVTLTASDKDDAKQKAIALLSRPTSPPRVLESRLSVVDVKEIPEFHHIEWCEQQTEQDQAK